MLSRKNQMLRNKESKELKMNKKPVNRTQISIIKVLKNPGTKNNNVAS